MAVIHDLDECRAGAISSLFDMSNKAMIRAPELLLGNCQRVSRNISIVAEMVSFRRQPIRVALKYGHVRVGVGLFIPVIVV